MAKYEQGGRRDPYTDPETDILYNKVGAQNQAELDQREAMMVATRTYELRLRPEPGKFDLDHMQRIHARQFGDVYDFAGKLRTVDITKGDTVFARQEMIPGAGDKLFRELANERHLKGLDADEFSKRAGHYLGEVNVLHPFREGNGRTQREFVGQIADEAGYKIDWKNIAREDMTRASVAAYNGDSTQLASLIRSNLEDRERTKAEALARDAAGPSAQLTRAEPGQSYEGRVIGVTERYVVQERADHPREVVLHNRRALTGPEHMTGRNMSIAYPHGQAGLAREAGSPTHQLDRGGPEREK